MMLSQMEVKARMINLGMSGADVRRAAHISSEAWNNAYHEREIWWDTAKAVADALGEKNFLPIIHPSKLVGLAGLSSMPVGQSGLPDWEPDTPVLGLTEASNGLRFVVWMLRHRTERNCYARGKQYDLRLLPTDKQDQLEEYLARHSDVCNLVRRHPRFPQHITTTFDAKADVWWTIDAWDPGKTLAETLYRQELKREVVPRVMLQIAEGLKALHEAKIIRRELSPRNILLQETDQSVLLTDFELGKLLEDVPTVSNNWPWDPYRAPEVGAKPLTEKDMHVDLYSWAKILLHCVIGETAIRGGDLDSIDELDLPPKVCNIVKRCLSEPRKRPKRVDAVLKAIQSWEE